MSVVQSAVAKHFATPPIHLQHSNSPPSKWKALIEQARNKMNKST